VLRRTIQDDTGAGSVPRRGLLCLRPNDHAAAPGARKTLEANSNPIDNSPMSLPPDTPNASLYRRLGGYDAIAGIVDDLFALLRADPSFARFAFGRSTDSHLRARQLLVDQLCALSGGPCIYIGRDMKTSHAGLGITEAEWETNLHYAQQVLARHNVAPQEQTGFLNSSPGTSRTSSNALPCDSDVPSAAHHLRRGGARDWQSSVLPATHQGATRAPAQHGRNGEH
jgi:hemoglobin